MSQPHKILVVDDSETTADDLAALIRLHLPDVVTLTAADGLAAISTALRERPSAIITDIGMPALDGVGLASAIRNYFRGAAPMLIAISGDAPRVEILKDQSLFDHVFAKPVDVANLVSILDRAH